MEHTDLVASELNSTGFEIELLGSAIRVSLQNRKVSQMEVEAFLDQDFYGCGLIVEQVYDGVEVTVE